MTLDHADVGPKSQTILVVGGGIAEITAALEAAETGHEVVLLERGPSLGGRLTRLNRYFPKLSHPTCGIQINYRRIKKNPRLKVLSMGEPVKVAGNRGAYAVTVKRSPRYVTDKCTACLPGSSRRFRNAHHHGS